MLAGSSFRKSRASERKVDGVSRCGVWPASATTASRAPGCPAATASARAQPVGSSAPAMTSVGARTSARRSWRGSMVPCPAPRRLVARPAGRLRRRSARRRAARAGGSAAWLAKTGSRCHSSTKASIPSRSSRSARASSAARRAPRSDARREARRRTFEDEASHDRRVRDGQPQRDPRAERVAQDVRRREARPRSGSPRGRPRCARREARAGSDGVPDRPCPGRSTTTVAERPGEGRRVAAPARSAPGEPVEQEQRHAGPACPDLPAKAVDVDAHRGADGGGDGGGRLAMELDVARAVRAEREDLHPGSRHGVGQGGPDGARTDRPGTPRRGP